MKRIGLILSLFLVLASGCERDQPVLKSFSGIYPHLAFYNNEGECGTGAVVPWAGRLYVVTYGPHLPLGSSDKLYEISNNLTVKAFDRSVGGTPANRMVHNESNQLFIGPYAIDSSGNIRVLPPSIMPGRHTANARHLSDPANKIYYLTMEEGLYEVDVNTLSVKCIFRDGNIKSDTIGTPLALLPGAHGKGAYSGQGALVYSNNGELTDEAMSRFDALSGSLNEWDGKEWKTIRRNQFMEISGPGGIYGNSNPDDPVWATGFDHKSLLVGVREKGKWSFFRLPKASHTYDGAHGWNTEWPRIRNVGTASKPFYLMTMHGLFWRFPGSFSAADNAGIRPLSAYLKVIGDFCRWNDSLVFGCDDSAEREFLNKRKVKGGIAGPGQSNSNLWFTSFDKPAELGPATAEGAVWFSEKVIADEWSEPFLFDGWDKRSAWVLNEGVNEVTLAFEVDKDGTGKWADLRKVKIRAGESAFIDFSVDEKGEWIRVSTDRSSVLTAHFCYGANDKRTEVSDDVFLGISGIGDPESDAGLLRGLGDNRRKLGMVAGTATDSLFAETGYYELDSLMNLVRKDDQETALFIRKNVTIPANTVITDSASVLIIDDKGRRWRLPKGDPGFAQLAERSLLRICREVATERDLFNCSGTFYELPAENADGFAKIRPVASHNFRIHDYASYRGMLILTGISSKQGAGAHIIRSSDGKAAVWAGVIDDLWKMGKPVGEGGPWKKSKVKAGVPSDPYLAGFYDRKTITLTNHSVKKVIFTIEADPGGAGKWIKYKEVSTNPESEWSEMLPESFQARWIRVVTNEDCNASVFLRYE